MTTKHNDGIEERAKAWLESNTPLRWTITATGAEKDIPLADLNRRPKVWADRFATFARTETATLTARVKELEDGLRELHDTVLAGRGFADALDRAKELLDR